jgi:flagellar motor switch protein FliN
MNETLLKDRLAALMECLGRTWVDAITRLRGVPHEIAITDTAPTEIGSQPLWLTLSLEGTIRGEAALLICSADADILLEKMAGSGSDASTPALDDTVRVRAVQDLLRQPLVLALQDFQTRTGPLVAHIKVADAPACQPQRTFTITASAKDVPPVAVSLFCSQGLTAETPQKSVPDLQTNLDRVLDANLEVSLRFGEQRLALGELALLGPGSVLELDRKVKEPVELVLGGKVLARGDVVIVDGNYGLRVTELCNWRQ